MFNNAERVRSKREAQGMRHYTRDKDYATSFVMNERLAQAVQAYATKNGISVSATIRKGLSIFLLGDDGVTE